MPNTLSYIKSLVGRAKALGAKATAADAQFIIHGHEEAALLISQFPWPINSPGEGVEIFLPGGIKTTQPGQTQTNFTGQISIYETRAGSADALARALLQAGGTFDATVVAGPLEKPDRSVEIVDCFITFEAGEIDWSSSGEPLRFSGTLDYNYFGDKSE